MTDDAVVLYKLYNKDELLDICEELQLPKFSMKDTSKTLVSMIEADFDENGIPPDDDCSDLLYNFIRDGGWADEEESDEVEEPEVEEEVKPVPEQPVEEVEMPDCFGWADERDKSCKICKVFDLCMTERIAIREQELPCFGLLYAVNDEQCMNCLEAGPCRLIVEKNIKVVK